MPKVHDDNTPQKPKLVNRGGAGLYGKIKGRLIFKDRNDTPKIKVTAKYRVPPDLQAFIVPINTIILDPQNARLHPERNLQAIRDSLTQYGQQKVIVVRKATNVVIAGNGTLEAARSLGWTEIAARFTDMNDVEAAGYGLADNKTAELAKWDFEIATRLNRLVEEAGHQVIGWTQQEMDLFRAVSWVPPGDDNSMPYEKEMVLKLTKEEEDFVIRAIDLWRRTNKNLKNDGTCVAAICASWLGLQE